MHWLLIIPLTLALVLTSVAASQTEQREEVKSSSSAVDEPNSANDVEAQKRGWNDLQAAWGKRAWNDLQAAWGKRAWNDLRAGWGKRAWNDLNGAWGKRAWNDLQGAWGKRDDDKRGWDHLQGSWGKRVTSGWDDAEDLNGSEVDWQDGDQLVDSGVKRDADWHAFRGSWGKRSPSWNNLKGLWGKRSGNNWSRLNGLWGKRAADMEGQ